MKNAKSLSVPGKKDPKKKNSSSAVNDNGSNGKNSNGKSAAGLKLAPLDNAPKLDSVFANTPEQMEEISELLKSEVAITFNTNVLKIALNAREDKIASIITAFYPIRIDEEIVMRAIKSS